MTLISRLVPVTLVWVMNIALTQSPKDQQTQPPPAYHPTFGGCSNTANSEARIERRPTSSSSGDRISYSCRNCKNREAEITESVEQLKKIEASACFRNFLLFQDPLDEPHGNTNEQIVDDLSKIPVTVTFKFHWGVGGACGGLNDNGTHTIDTKNSCWDWYNPELRAGYIGHELSHEVGYTHYCTIRNWNNREGNEMTVPYAAEAAIEACYAEVIKGEASKPLVKILRAVSTDSEKKPIKTRDFN